MQLALTPHGAVQFEGKGETHTFLLLTANSNAHFVEGAEK